MKTTEKQKQKKGIKSIHEDKAWFQQGKMNSALIETLKIRGAKGHDYWAAFGGWYIVQEQKVRLEILSELDYKSNPKNYKGDYSFTEKERFMFRELYVIASKCELGINSLCFSPKLFNPNKNK